MINEVNAVAEEKLNVLEGIELNGQVNVEDEILINNVRSSIRRPYQQIRPQQPNYDHVALVGSGPSLLDTEGELFDLIKLGGKVVTVNGAYQWCLDRNIVPKTQIVLDARPSNARFLEPYIPDCNYVLASQCAPEAWDAVEGRKNVWMFHAVQSSTGPLRELLDAHYLNRWFGVGGGVTVITRAISLLRTLGYLRFDLFGVDSCFMHGQHHAFEQAENEKDRAFRFQVSLTDDPENKRIFYCAPWHAKQFECMLQMIRVNGDHFLLNVHGDGLLAYALKASAGVQYTRLDDSKE
jgi:hypothetical protein